MKIIKNSIYALALVVLFSACEEKIDLDLSFAGQKPVVEGRVVTETDSSFIKLTYTAPYNSNQDPQGITNATVEVAMDNKPPVLFNHVGKGIYKPAAGFVGEKDHNYSLRVVIDGKEYTSQSYLYPMFTVDDSLTQEFKAASGFSDEGYAITFYGIYDQKPIKDYWFNFGKNDSLEDGDIVFDNSDLKLNQRLPFELPFFRANKGDSVMLIFRSIDKDVRNYLIALGNLTGDTPGLFQAPPANPPTNIKGGAVGFFYSADVIRRWRVVN